MRWEQTSLHTCLTFDIYTLFLTNTCTRNAIPRGLEDEHARALKHKMHMCYVENDWYFTGGTWQDKCRSAYRTSRASALRRIIRFNNFYTQVTPCRWPCGWGAPFLLLAGACMLRKVNNNMCDPYTLIHLRIIDNWWFEILAPSPVKTGNPSVLWETSHNFTHWTPLALHLLLAHRALNPSAWQPYCLLLQIGHMVCVSRMFSLALNLVRLVHISHHVPAAVCQCCQGLDDIAIHVFMPLKGISAEAYN